ncbi:hypothetical protein [Prochlorococcus sp. MIT 1011]|uniref:hypothetical protein n=1 Tax=Prochlorococcus sp. MIT 1011 TaxID=3082520 RepID=UPI0039B6BBA4
MKPIFILLKNFKNLLPYFLLIALYFFFINLETRKKKINNKIIEIEKQLVEDESIGYDKKKLRIAIPVVPYKE